MLSKVDNEKVLPLTIRDDINKYNKEEIEQEDMDTMDLKKTIKNIARMRD